MMWSPWPLLFVCLASLVCLARPTQDVIQLQASVVVSMGASQIIDHAFASISIPVHGFWQYGGINFLIRVYFFDP
jgi:hypothetical protein